MNYYLDDLRTILSQNNTALSYTGYNIDSIKVDMLVEPETYTSQNSFILLESQGGQSEKVFLESLDFAVYVYDVSPTIANNKAMSIYQFLHRYTGTLATAGSVHFRRIKPRQSPMRFSASSSPVSVFFFTMTAEINNSSNNIIT